MGVLHSIPLCSRGNGANVVEPLDLDKNNNEAAASSVVYTSQPQTALTASAAVPPPEATSTPVRPQSPTGLINEQYSDSLQWVKLLFLNLSILFWR